MSFVLLLLGLIAAGTAIWFITPAWQCPVCHSYKIVEYEDGTVECLGCNHTWRAI